jgi:hypothetical protein
LRAVFFVAFFFVAVFFVAVFLRAFFAAMLSPPVIRFECEHALL